MANDPLFLLAVGAVLLVGFVLLFGLGTFLKGGAFNRKYGNKIMRIRVAAQAIAILLILLFVLIRRQMG
ncbi:MAG: twin transmembrane helix small protein [Paracoccaceae bacterium]|nr:twin transmembrane helix small protein [Paracoccaceae bacterium]